MAQAKIANNSKREDLSLSNRVEILEQELARAEGMIAQYRKIMYGRAGSSEQKMS